MLGLHPTIENELNCLAKLFPGKDVFTLTEYAIYFGITRTYAAEHFRRMNSGPHKLPHKRFGRKITFIAQDFAIWLARHTIENGEFIELELSASEIQQRRRR